MPRVRALAIGGFAAAVLAGTLTDVPRRAAPASPAVLAGDFHVHAAPGDGLLPVWEVRREAERRGLDVIAITNHNHALASRLSRWAGLESAYPIVIHGQEVTTSGFHIAAVGVATMVESRLPAREAIAAIHAQGGVAIASHPIDDSWTERDIEALSALDGVEVAHPVVLASAEWKQEVEEFHRRARAVNPDVAAIGSSDFHGGPIGRCRTFLVVDEPSAAGVLEAIRRGRTEARCGGPDAAGFGYGLPTWIALAALGALAVTVK
jgi:hypothetical protein